MHIEPPLPRYKIENKAAGDVSAVIRARKNWFIILFLGVWLGGWFMGEASAIQELSRAETANGFIAFWLVGWTIAGCGALLVLLWQLFGQETVSVRQGFFIHKVEVLWLHRTRSFTLSKVQRLRSVEFATGLFTHRAAWMPPVFGSGLGAVAFDYGARTFRLAPSLDEAEARALVEQLSLYISHK